MPGTTFLLVLSTPFWAAATTSVKTPSGPMSIGAYLGFTVLIISVCLPIAAFILKHFQSRETAGLRTTMEKGFSDLRQQFSDGQNSSQNNRSEINRLCKDLSEIREEMRDRCAALEKSHSACENGRREFESGIQLEISDKLNKIGLELTELRGAMERFQEGTGRDLREVHTTVKSEVLAEILRHLSTRSGT